MGKIKLKDQLNRVIQIDSDATQGATVGKDLRWPSGAVVKESELRQPATPGATGNASPTLWKLIREIPVNIQKLAKLAGTGFTTRGGDGEWYQRSIDQGVGIDVAGGDGVAGNPVVSLAELDDAGGGTLQKTARDSYGRVSGTGTATTDDLDEGTSNLWYTDARAAAAAPVQSVNGETGAVDISAADVGADPAGTASAAVASHEAQPSPHPQYQSKLPPGASDQFWRGDGVWSNELMGGLNVTAPVAPLTFRVTQAAFGNMAMGQWDVFGTHDGSTFNACVTITPRAAAAWTPTEKPTLIQFRTVRTGSAVLSEHCRFGASGEIAPGSDNSQDFGRPDRRWGVLYAGTGTINTSDGREKTSVRPLSAAELAAAIELGGEIGVYQWLAMIAEKGDGAREHIGMTVQQAISILESHDLDPFAYGFICYDEWDELPEVVDEAGEVVQEYRPAGDRYSFRMDELLAFVARGLSHRLDCVEQRLTAAGL